MPVKPVATAAVGPLDRFFGVSAVGTVGGVRTSHGDNLDQYLNAEMPPLHYTLCGCEDMTNYPDAWKNVDVNKYKDVP